MKHNLNNSLSATEEVQNLPDECGDTMWDAVLAQDVKVCKTNTVSENAALLLNSIQNPEECDASKA